MNEIIDGFITAVILIVTLDPEVYEIAFRSIYITLTATIIASVISIPIAMYLAFHDFRGKMSLVNLIHTLYALPTVLIGLLVFLLLSRKGPLGFFGLLFTPGAMIIGQVILIIPILVGLTYSALTSLDPVVKDTIISLGADYLQFVMSILREVRFVIYAAIAMAFGRAISEVGAAIIIGGNIKGSTRVLTTAISLETSMGNIEFSMALGIILLFIALIVNFVMTAIRRGG
ncbi:ABC transporter permease [Methanogenium organophilum]|uniref:ABC transporter permease n=1 Tax=Methanogenium organophilum TaxID=2199 RepID=A0A9X9S4I2_METOG|nr:ABC transporter permease [Methanogenium organophilum]WAI01386.1 ABC transporter permease [Methanogenium organophilum]